MDSLKASLDEKTFVSKTKEVQGHRIYSSSKEPSKTFAEVPQDKCLGKLVTALKCEVKMGRLANKVRKWFHETQGKQGDLQYHFTGKESRLLCHNFARLLTFFEGGGRQSETTADCADVGLKAEGFVLDHQSI